jgi:hypothetical protein
MEMKKEKKQRVYLQSIQLSQLYSPMAMVPMFSISVAMLHWHVERTQAPIAAAPVRLPLTVEGLTVPMSRSWMWAPAMKPWL